MIETLKQDIHYLTLDLHKGTSDEVRFKQGDHESRILEVTLMAHDRFVDLNNARVDLWVYKSDDKLAVKQCDTDVDSSIVRVALTRQMLAIMPSIRCEFVITYDDNSVLTFPYFDIDLDQSIVDEQRVVSSDEFNLFFYALSRMENWITTFDVKYNTVSKIFDDKLKLINDTFELKMQSIDERFELLHNDLTTTITGDYEQLKNEMIELYKQNYKEINSQFAIKFKEVEKRFNTLEQKAVSQTDNIEVLLNTCIEMEESIQQLKQSSQDCLDAINNVFNQAEETYNEIIAFFEDVKIKFQQMQNQFALDQTTRKNEFDNAQRDRQNSFISSENERSSAFATSQQNRQEAFEQSELERNNAELARVDAENQREQTFAQMETKMNEIYSSTLKYRYIE